MKRIDVMTRPTKAGLALLIGGLVCLLKGSPPLIITATAQGQANAEQRAEESTRDAPPDTTPYWRPAVSEDYAQKAQDQFLSSPAFSSWTPW